MKLTDSLHIYSKDPALATDAQGFEDAMKAFRDTGDVKAVPCKDGRRPVIWKLRSLSEGAYSEVTRSSYQELQRRLGMGISAVLDRSFYGEQREAFRLGVVGLDNAVDANNSPIVVSVENTETNARGEKVLAWKFVDALFQRFKAGVIGEVGARVLELCELGPT